MRHIKCRNQWVPVPKPEILGGTITFRGKTYELLKNQFSVMDGTSTDHVYIYHSYDYIDENGAIYHGRWYNTEFPRTGLPRNGAKEFHYEMEFYEMEDESEETSAPCQIHLTFSDKAAQRLNAV